METEIKAMTEDWAIEVTNQIIDEVDRQMRGGGIHLTVLAMRVLKIVDAKKDRIEQ